MKILYFDCFAGISGDMTLAAFLDLGVPIDYLQRELAKLPLPLSSYTISAEKRARKGIAATGLLVHVEEHQPHRHYTHIAAMIEGSGLTEKAKEIAQRIFFRLAEAEAKVHGVEMGEVHFHEVGAVDSIIDIVGTAICLDYLQIKEVYASSLPLGGGYVETAHGKLPVPAPATAELLKGMSVHGELGEGERVTPTGAAIVAALADGSGRLPAMAVAAIGCGAGSKDFPDVPNILRLVMGEKHATLFRDEVVVIETHIDDMNQELLGHLMERLLAAGALDVAFSPLQMKKNRPGVKLTVLSPPELLEALSRLILTESTAIGVRHYLTERIISNRSVEVRQTSLGQVQVKVIMDGEKVLRVVPEFEACRKIAEERRLPLIDVYRTIERETAS